jgi:Skp family chaperone for outer membrane proteins
MKRVSLLALGLVFAAACAVSASAQPAGVPAQTAAPIPGKVVWLDSSAFGDDKEGISKYIQAQKSLEGEVKPKSDELKTIQTQLQTLQTEIENLQKQANGANPAVNVNAIAKQIQDKTDQGQTLQRSFEFKQKEAQAYYQKRAGEVLGPIQQAIATSLREYAKSKGFTVVLDIAVMAGDQQTPSSILYLDPSADVTRDFITYFNRTGGAATAATTKP